MKEANRKKLATIKTKIANGQFSTMARIWKEDRDYESALKILGDAITEIEKRFGYLD